MISGNVVWDPFTEVNKSDFVMEIFKKEIRSRALRLEFARKMENEFSQEFADIIDVSLCPKLERCLS